MLTLTKYGAEWCAPCKAMDNFIANKAHDANVAYDPEKDNIDVQHSPERVDIPEVTNIPVLVVRDEQGTIVGRHDGAMAPSALTRWLEGLQNAR